MKWVTFIPINFNKKSYFWRFVDRASQYISQYLTNLMHKICFTISFISCLYMFRAHVVIIRTSKLHYTAYRCDDTRGRVMQFWRPDDEHMCSKYVRHEIKLIVKQILCIKLVKYWEKFVRLGNARCIASKKGGGGGGGKCKFKNFHPHFIRTRFKKLTIFFAGKNWTH